MNCHSPNFQGFILMKNALNNQVGMLGDMFLWLVANLKQGGIYFIKQVCGNDILASVYDIRCFLGIFDLPTHPNQMVYYMGLFSKIRCSLTYIPPQKSDVICECSLSIISNLFDKSSGPLKVALSQNWRIFTSPNKYSKPLQFWAENLNSSPITAYNLFKFSVQDRDLEYFF